jgi:signal transduction histidine kinase
MMRASLCNAADLPAVLCDPDQIQQVLSNLLINARQVLEERPQPRHVRLTARADAEWVRLEVADNGPGIAEPIRSRVFDPFFTTKPVKDSLLDVQHLQTA